MKLRLPENLERDAIAALLAALLVLMLAAGVMRQLNPVWEGYLLRLASACLAWLVSLGMARAAALGTHIKTLSLVPLAPEARRRGLFRLADMVFFAFSLATLAIGCLVFCLALGRGFPGHPLVYAAPPAGSLLTMLRIYGRRRDAAA
jgi:TRAP-type C4-dicarboxylate transport system permease small subunit